MQLVIKRDPFRGAFGAPSASNKDRIPSHDVLSNVNDYAYRMERQLRSPNISLTTPKYLDNRYVE